MQSACPLCFTCSLWLSTLNILWQNLNVKHNYSPLLAPCDFWQCIASSIFSFLLWDFPCWTFLNLKFRASKCEVWTCECWENCVINRLWGHWLLFDTLNTCISLAQILEVKVRHANDALDVLDAFNVELFIFQNNMWMEVVKVIKPFLQFLHAYNSH